MHLSAAEAGIFIRSSEIDIGEERRGKRDRRDKGRRI